MATYVAPSSRGATDGADDVADLAPGMSARGAATGSRLTAQGAELAAAATGSAVAGAPPATSSAAAAGAPAGEAPVAELAQAYAVPAPQRARFESVYLALSRSSEGASLSPSVRAARALAIAARSEHGGEATAATARERAAAAWSVLPVVYAMPQLGADGGTGDAADGSGGAAPGATGLASAWAMPVVGRGAGPDASRGVGRAPQAGAAAYAPGADFASPEDRELVLPETRAGLSHLASRVGEALGSFVRPASAEVTTSAAAAAASRRDHAAIAHSRTIPEPTIHELVRTGRAHARTGGGETEIPSWFESAARRMLDQRGAGDGISMAELTLISTAPTAQVAASSRSASGSSAPSQPSGTGGQADAQQGAQPDIEKIAQQVYGEIMKLIDIARERSGDPWH